VPRTHTEFYEVNASFDLLELKRVLLKWEIMYDTVRPSQALGHPYITGISGTILAK
jgi:hypothetical protein